MIFKKIGNPAFHIALKVFVIIVAVIVAIVLIINNVRESSNSKKSENLPAVERVYDEETKEVIEENKSITLERPKNEEYEDRYGEGQASDEVPEKISKERFIELIQRVSESNDVKIIKTENSSVDGLDTTEFSLDFNLTKVKYLEKNGAFHSIEFDNVYDLTNDKLYDPFVNEELVKSYIAHLIRDLFTKEQYSDDDFVVYHHKISEAINLNSIAEISDSFEKYNLRFKIEPIEFDGSKNLIQFSIISK